MAGPIVISEIVTASSTDVLQGTRLQTVPAGGFLTFEILSSSNTATDFSTASIQMPNGDTPLNAVRVPAGTNIGSLDNRETLIITLPIQQGGHTVFSLEETGAVTVAYRVTYSPA